MIELLVVVAIIAILAAMLLPAMQGAKQAARSTVCTNHLRQLGIAALMYADDYQERFPPAYEPGAGPYYQHFPAYLRHYLGGVNGSLESHSLTNFTLNPPIMANEIRSTGEIFNQGMDRTRASFNNVFECPSTFGPMPTMFGAVGDGYVWSDYTYNANVGGYPPTWYPATRGQIPRPTLTPLLMDGFGWAGMIGNASYYEISPRHQRLSRANVLLVDGHVESCRWKLIFGNDDSQDISASAPSTGPGGFKAYYGGL